MAVYIVFNAYIRISNLYMSKWLPTIDVVVEMRFREKKKPFPE